ncbi:MAG TPA: FeoC-like transcriptional regulator [Legionellaceae bacterium]|nr:FeoC-like transcriptional regulator [Legionellaceae bacterium]
MLLALRDYIKRYQMVSTEQLVREFHMAAEALEPMLEIWIQKGKIQLCTDKKRCGTSCQSCQPQVYYEWCDSSSS